MLNGDIPGLVVDARADDVDLFLFQPERVGDLGVPAHHAVAESYGAHLAVFVGRPGRHGVGVTVVQHQGARRADLADVLAKIQHRGHHPLAVHDAARAERVAHALVDAVFQRNFDVDGKRFQPADADAVDDIFRALQGGAAVRRGLDDGPDTVLVEIALAQRPHHLEVVRVDVGERDFDFTPKRPHRHQVGQQRAGKPDAPRADKTHFKWHINSLCFSRPVKIRNGPRPFIAPILT